MTLDLDFVRSQFPAFEQVELQGQSFFENAGGSYTAKPVIERLMRYYTQRKVQPYSAYEASSLGGQEMDEARTRMAAILGVATDELSFGPSTTQNTYVLAQAFRKWLSPGDVIIVTNQDHEANTGPWRRLEDEGITIREWCVNADTGHLDTEDLQNLLDDNVRLVCFPHCSNVVGEINPVAEITALAHAAGAFTCVDGVSYAPHGIPNVAALGADIYLFSAYKTYGPHQGVMAIRRNLAAPSVLKATLGPDLTEIPAFATRLEAWGAENALSDADVHALSLSLDELMTNAIEYGAKGAPEAGFEMTVELSCEGGAVTATLSDNGAPFDPLTAAPPDLDSAAEDREIGGLGVHFAKTLTDTQHYRHENGRNVLALTKSLQGDDLT